MSTGGSNLEAPPLSEVTENPSTLGVKASEKAGFHLPGALGLVSAFMDPGLSPLQPAMTLQG